MKREEIDELGEWRSHLLQLGDRTFFDLIRNYLGPVKTPYNKHDLIRKLEVFLSRDKIQQAMVALTDPIQAQVLSALAFLGPRDSQTLLGFLGRELTRLESYRALANLEDRLVLFRNPEGSIAYNPLVKARFSKEFGHPGALFSSYRREELPFPEVTEIPPIPWANDLSLQGLYVLLGRSFPVFRQNRWFLKKFLDQVESKIPGFFSTADRILGAINGLLALGLVTPNPDEPRDLLTLNNRWSQIFDLSPWERTIMWWSGIIESDQASKGELPLDQDEVNFLNFENQHRISGALGSLLVLLEDNRWYPRDVLERIVSTFLSLEPALETTIIPGLIFLQALIPGPENTYARNPNLVHLSKEKLSDPSTLPPGAGRVESDGRVTLQAWVPAEISGPLLPLFSLEKVEYVLYLQLSRTGANFLFSRGHKANSLVSSLESLTQGPLPQVVRATLTEWDRDFFSAQASRGILLRLSPEKEALLLHDPRTLGLGVISLGQGICFLPAQPSNEFRLFEDLGALGIPLETLLPSLINVDPGFPDLRPLPLPPRGLERISRVIHTLPPNHETEDHRSTQAQIIRQSLQEKLRGLKIDDDFRRELEYRVEKGILLSESQIRSGIARPEMTQAGSLDHTGKLRLIETAIHSQDLLEVQIAPQGGANDPAEILLLPLSILRQGGEQILRGRIEPQGSEMTIQISRIQYLRRLKSGLFK